MKVVISCSTFQSQVCDFLPCNEGIKSQLILAMINSYNLLNHFDKVLGTYCASKQELARYHDDNYLDVLLQDTYIDPIKFNKKFTLFQMADSWYKLNDDYHLALNWFSCKEELYNYFKTLKPQFLSKKRCRWEMIENNKNIEENDQFNFEVDISNLQKYGLVHDCPNFPGLPMYIGVITGATLSLINELKINEPGIAINWDGGRHHAFKARATGFCYINDIILLIQLLRRKNFGKISYLDLDLHHGDGVEKAFKYSKNIQTCSLHLYEDGFFPGTGSLKDSNGLSTMNIPLLHGLDDVHFNKVINTLVLPSIKSHNPDVLIILCGGDGLADDKYNEWQISIKCMTENIIKLIKEFSTKSIILLGGGGYNARLMSRFYTYLTSEILKTFKDVPSPFKDEDDIIVNHEFIDLYKEEHYKFWYHELNRGNNKTLINNNNDEYLKKLYHNYKIFS